MQPKHVSYTARERLELTFRELGAKFGVSDSRCGVLLIPQLSHADFADMIGSSRPMVSRLIADMTEEKLLSRQGMQFVLHGILTTRKTPEFDDAAKTDGSYASIKTKTGAAI
jgi:hypothetical protein